MKLDQPKETQLQAIWLFVAASFTAIIEAQLAQNITFIAVLIVLLFSACLIMWEIKLILSRELASGSLLVTSIAACLFCAFSAFKGCNTIAAGVMALFSIGLGLIAIFWQNISTPRCWLSEIYIAIYLIIVGSCIAIIPTIVLYCFTPQNNINESYSFLEQVSLASHIFPLTLAVWLGLFIGVTKVYTILFHGNIDWYTIRKRWLVILILSLVGAFFSYDQPRGWLSKDFLDRCVMVFFGLLYAMLYVVMPFVGTSFYKKRGKHNMWFCFSLLLILAAVLQSSITYFIRLLFFSHIDTFFYYHLSVDLFIAMEICLACYITFLVNKKLIEKNILP